MQTLPDTVFRSTLMQAKSGHREALAWLYCQFQPAIFKFISRHVSSPIETEDITSEVFMIMQRDISTLRGQDEVVFKAWLFRIANMELVRYYRMREQEQKVTIRMESVHGIPAHDDLTEQAEVRETLADTIAFINALTTEKRQVVLSKVRGIPDAFLSQVLGKSVSAIRATRSRTLQFMQSKVGIAVIVTFLACSLLLIGNMLGIIVRSGAQPGGILYPIKQIVAPTDTPTPIATPQIFIPPIPVQTPASTPMPTPTNTPTPTPTPIPASQPTPAPTIQATVPANAPLVCALQICV